MALDLPGSECAGAPETRGSGASFALTIGNRARQERFWAFPRPTFIRANSPSQPPKHPQHPQGHPRSGRRSGRARVIPSFGRPRVRERRRCGKPGSLRVRQRTRCERRTRCGKPGSLRVRQRRRCERRTRRGRPGSPRVRRRRRCVKRSRCEKPLLCRSDCLSHWHDLASMVPMPRSRGGVPTYGALVSGRS